MRDRPADISDSVDDTNRDSDAPTQLWSGRLSFASLTPRLRAARHRQRLEALLNTQTGITFEVAPEVVEAKPRSVRNEEQCAPPTAPSTNPPVVAKATVPTSMSGPQLAVFIAVGVAVGGIAALHMDHLLHPFARQARLSSADQHAAPQAPALAANAPDRPVADVQNRSDAPHAATPASPVQPARSPVPKQRAGGVDPPQVNVSAAVVAGPTKSDAHSVETSSELRIPTQLHPRINPLMTSSQVFKDK